MAYPSLPPPQHPFVNAQTGKIDDAWYRFLTQVVAQFITVDASIASGDAAAIASANSTASAALTAYRPTEELLVVASNETTSITAGTNKIRFRMPYAFTLSSIKGSLTVAQASGNIFTFDVTKNGSTIFSTKPTIDNTELTTVTAATPSVLSTTTFADDDLISIDVTQVGASSVAKGLKVTFIGTRI